MAIRKDDKNQETMRTLILTPSSSMKTSTTTEGSETKDSSCYFPGCRKDANCKCEICIASINATLDLMPQSHHRSTLTKLSAASKPPPRSPVAFKSSSPSTPKSSTKSTLRSGSVTVTPPLNSTARMSYHEKVKQKKKELVFGVLMMRFVLGLGLIFMAEFGFSWVVSGRFLQPKLSVDTVRNLGEKSLVFNDLAERVTSLKNGLQNLVDKEVSDCSSADSKWKINQDGLLLNSRCVLYKSTAEELSIWGWPLQTAGLLTAELSSRSFTVLSGSVTEWCNGEIRFMIRKANSSWGQDRWSASVLHLDQNTWILEYRQNPITENARLISAIWAFLKFRLTREMKKMKQDFWLFTDSRSQYADLSKRSMRVPT